MGETKTERFTGKDFIKGINRVPVNFNYAGLNWDFLKLLGEIAVYAAGKYGSAEQYADIRPQGEQSPINHIFEHAHQYMAREPHDKFTNIEYHLAAIAYNAMMEFYYLTHGGPTTTDKLYAPTNDGRVDLPWNETVVVYGEPGQVVELTPPEKPTEPSLKRLATFFTRGSDGGKREGTLPKTGN